MRYSLADAVGAAALAVVLTCVALGLCGCQPTIGCANYGECNEWSPFCYEYCCPGTHDPPGPTGECEDGSDESGVMEPPDHPLSYQGICDDIEEILVRSGAYAAGAIESPTMPPVCHWVHSYGSTAEPDVEASQVHVAQTLFGLPPTSALTLLSATWGPFDFLGYMPTNGFGNAICPTPDSTMIWDPNDHREALEPGQINISWWQDASTMLEYQGQHQYVMAFAIAEFEYRTGADDELIFPDPGFPVMQLTGGALVAPLHTSTILLSEDRFLLAAIFPALTERVPAVRVWWDFNPVIPHPEIFLEYYPRDNARYEHPGPVGALCAGRYDPDFSPPPSDFCQPLTFTPAAQLPSNCTGVGRAHIMGGVLGFTVRASGGAA